MNKKIGIPVLVVLLLGTSFFMWSRRPTVERSASIEEVKEDFTCPHCGHQFALSIREQRQMHRAHEGIVCPACGEKGASKDNVIVVISGGEEPSFDREEEDEDDDAPPLPPQPVGGTRKYDPDRP